MAVILGGLTFNFASNGWLPKGMIACTAAAVDQNRKFKTRNQSCGKVCEDA